MTEPISEYEPIVYIEEPYFNFELEQEIDQIKKKKAIALAIKKNIQKRIVENNTKTKIRRR